jgi:hypothetical protein
MIQLDMTVPVAVALAEYNEAADDPHCQRAKLEALARRYTVLRNRETRGSKAPPEPISYDAPAGPPEDETHNTAFPPQPESRSTRPATLHTPTPTPTSMPKKPPIPGSSDRFNALYKALGYDRYGGGKAFAEVCRVSPSTIFQAGRKDLIPATADIIAKAMNVPPEYFTGKTALSAVIGAARTFQGCTRSGATPKPAPGKPAPFKSHFKCPRCHQLLTQGKTTELGNLRLDCIGCDIHAVGETLAIAHDILCRETPDILEDTRARVSRQDVSEQDRLWLDEKKKEAEQKHGPLTPVITPVPLPVYPFGFAATAATAAVTPPLADTIANLRNRLAAAQQQADHYTRAIAALEAIA